jgi:hypothetical protein
MSPVPVSCTEPGLGKCILEGFCQYKLLDTNYEVTIAASQNGMTLEETGKGELIQS